MLSAPETLRVWSVPVKGEGAVVGRRSLYKSSKRRGRLWHVSRYIGAMGEALGAQFHALWNWSSLKGGSHSQVKCQTPSNQIGYYKPHVKDFC